jgi:hypothetical protein
MGHLQLPDWWVEREVEVRSTWMEVGGVAFQRAGRGAAHGPVRPACPVVFVDLRVLEVVQSFFSRFWCSFSFSF